MRLSPRVWMLFAALTSLAMADAARAASADEVPEYEVKAEFIERFTRFIDWPDPSFASPTAPFVVCSWGTGPLVDHLEHLLVRRSIKSRPVRLLRVSSLDSIASCHILYVASSEQNIARVISARTYGKPVLSIGDQPGLAQAGLLLNLVVDEDRFVRFEINRDVARVSGLRISAKLMRLARLVTGRR